jgi:two-component system OmpR family sensor kinase/two-component system sensor histidine kinase QseC
VERASSVISLEQRFTSVAAHELMSPLAGIRAQAQLARRAASQEELQQALQAVMTGVDHAARVFEQLLDLTRMEGLSHERQSQFKPIDLQAMLQNVHDELRPILMRKSMRYLESCKARELQGVEFAIYLLLRNLVANAIRYTPEGGTVEVSSVQIGDQLLLCVDDSGPGIPEADRQRVFERFNRLQQSGDEGIGLGLFIAQQAAVLHGASIELLDSPLGGLRAQVCFSPAVQFAI